VHVRDEPGVLPGRSRDPARIYAGCAGADQFSWAGEASRLLCLGAAPGYRRLGLLPGRRHAARADCLPARSHAWLEGRPILAADGTDPQPDTVACLQPAQTPGRNAAPELSGDRARRGQRAVLPVASVARRI